MPDQMPIKIEDVKRLDVRPGDQLVVTVAGNLPPDAVQDIADQVRSGVGDEVAVLVVTSEITVAVVRTEDALERIADRAALLLEERATQNRLRSCGGIHA